MNKQVNSLCPMVNHADYYCNEKCQWFQNVTRNPETGLTEISGKCVIEVIAEQLSWIATFLGSR